ncbi:LysR substrate-binding domain-containing protein [Microbacteriaceae bacterium K1510]|nr:LysR substrate-binding domain-containing protein [Microbacteriaceae bacterium K1510]
MEIRHLRYFVTVAEELHFSRAADRLKIAPPTLSHGIAALESELGTRLFSRKTKSAVTLTNAGKRFLDEAQIALRHFRDAETAGKRAARGEIGTIAIGYMHAASCSAIVSESIAKFSSAWPGVAFDLTHRDTFSQMAAIADDVIDVGFIRRPQRYLAGLSGFVVLRCPFWAAIPKSHPLAASERVTQAALAKENLLALTIEMEAGIWGNIAAVLPSNSIPQVNQRAPDSFTLLTLVGAGVGITIVPEPLRRLDIPGVIYRRIAGTQRQCEIAVVHRAAESSPAVRAYIASLRKMRA